ncbi:8864_t:CDS:2 [Entrophospora sp. SA101]|nr:8864_t:CDS:2 [Entrophospora sp. SA101]
MSQNNKCYGCHQDLSGEYCTLKKDKGVVENVHFKCWEVNQEQYKQEFDQITEKGKVIQTKCEENSCGKKFDPRTAEGLRHKGEQNVVDYPDLVGLEIVFASDLGSVYRLSFKEHEELNKNSTPVETMEDLAIGKNGKIKEDYYLMNCLAFSINIKSITLQGDKLLIEHSNNSNTETKPINTSELQLIQSYCQSQGLTSLSLSDLQKSQSPQTQQPTNYLPYILGGIRDIVSETPETPET